MSEREYWVCNQQRFEAALKILTTKSEYPDHITGDMGYPDVYEAIRQADELIAHLEETRTKK